MYILWSYEPSWQTPVCFSREFTICLILKFSSFSLVLEGFLQVLNAANQMPKRENTARSENRTEPRIIWNLLKPEKFSDVLLVAVDKAFREIHGYIHLRLEEPAMEVCYLKVHRWMARSRVDRGGRAVGFGG